MVFVGRLTLTNHALYFESLGVVLYDKAVRYDLGTDMKQVVKRELTRPLGARPLIKRLCTNQQLCVLCVNIKSRKVLYPRITNSRSWFLTPCFLFLSIVLFTE